MHSTKSAIRIIGKFPCRSIKSNGSAISFPVFRSVMFETAIDRLTQNRSMFVSYFMAWKFLLKLVLIHVTVEAQKYEVISLHDVMILQRKIINQLKLWQSYSRPPWRQEQKIRIKLGDLLLRFSLNSSRLPVSYLTVWILKYRPKQLLPACYETVTATAFI